MSGSENGVTESELGGGDSEQVTLEFGSALPSCDPVVTDTKEAVDTGNVSDIPIDNSVIPPESDPPDAGTNIPCPTEEESGLSGVEGGVNTTGDGGVGSNVLLIWISIIKISIFSKQ